MNTIYLIFILLISPIYTQVLTPQELKLNPSFPRSDIAFTQVKTRANNREDLCDIETTMGLCVNNGQRMFMKNAKIKDLICHISFDDSLGLDQSGLNNNADIVVQAAPSFMEQGHSGYFDGSSIMKIQSNQLFSAKVYSVSLWLFLLKEQKQVENNNVKPLRWCPIVLKGNDNHDKDRYERAPGIFIDRKDRVVRVVTSTSDRINNPQGESIISIAKIPFERWTHIAVIRGEKKITIFINGIKDSERPTEGWTSPNNYPLYLGGVPWHKDECSVPMYMDDFKFYVRQLETYEIQAEAAATLGGIEPNFYKLACQNCELIQAQQKCGGTEYRLCKAIELQSGGLQVAKAMGWIDENSNVWSESAAQNKEKSSEQGVGICCLNNL